MNWFIRRQRKVVVSPPTPVRPPLPSGYSLAEFRKQQGLTDGCRNFFDMDTGRHLLAMLYNEIPLGTLSTASANPIGSAIEHGETRGHLGVITILAAAQIFADVPKEVPQDYGASDAQE